jgi:hypothetical protein
LNSQGLKELEKSYKNVREAVFWVRQEKCRLGVEKLEKHSKSAAKRLCWVETPEKSLKVGRVVWYLRVDKFDKSLKIGRTGLQNLIIGQNRQQDCIFGVEKLDKSPKIGSKTALSGMKTR